MDGSEISVSPPPMSSFTTHRQIRSAESTPVMFRRYLRITGLFNYCTSHSMRPDAAADDEDDEDESGKTGSVVRGEQRHHRWHRFRRPRSPSSYSNSPASVPGSPSFLTPDHPGGRLSKRARIWRSLKKLNLRPRINTDASDTLRVPDHHHRPPASHNSRGEIEYGRRASFAESSLSTAANGRGSSQNNILNSGSHPNLSYDTTDDRGRRTKRLVTGESSFSPPQVTKVGGFFTWKKKKKAEALNHIVDHHQHNQSETPPPTLVIVGASSATPSTSGGCGSILVKNAAGLQRNSNRVEFASTDQVISLDDTAASVVHLHHTQQQQNTIEAGGGGGGGISRLSSDPPPGSTPLSMASPVKALFGRSHKKVERQTTFESTSSATAEDLLRQETFSGGSIAEPDSSAAISSYLLHVQLREGRDLVIRDASGSSDPYVKFKYRNKVIYKSNTIFKNLNPHWDETFLELIDDPAVPLHVDVFDYDRFASDDFMGAAELDLAHMEAKKPTELKVMLREENSDQYMGYLLMQVSLAPLTRDEQEQFLRKKARGSPEAAAGGVTAAAVGSVKRGQKGAQVWNSAVNIVLVEGKNLLPTDTHTSMPLPDPYVKFKLGVEKYKSKPATKTLDPKWLEQFDLHIFDDQNQHLEIMVFDKRKDIFMGRCKIDLSTIEREVTQQNWYELEDGAGQVLLLLTISGTVTAETVGDFTDQTASNAAVVAPKYMVSRTFDNLKDIGHLIVKVYRAQGLASADIGGKSDPFCVVELVNARLQTHTEYKTLNPEWNKIFTFNVKDIHSVLELTVFDEDPNKKVEFLGKVGVPLLKIRNGEKRWYALKDRKLQHRAKGQILLELEVVWNPIRGSIRTFNPKEEKYMSHENRFKRQTFMRNVLRVKNFAMAAMDVGAFVQSCFSWDSPPRSIIAFLVYMVVVYFFELYMLPVILLLLFVKAYVYKVIIAGIRQKEEEETYFESEEEDEEMDEKEERKSFKERLQAIQDTLAMVQNALDYIASSMERVKNTFNFTQPFLSWLAIVVLCAVTLGLYFIPIRWLAMAWGMNKFTKKLRSPNLVPNNELLDFLSRVPSDDEIRMFGEFRPDPVDGGAAAIAGQTARAKKQRSS